tara:strand:+ start:12234 stop:14210 length:1977 start_codon:yes stop_codon:yes gene_type:complete
MSMTSQLQRSRARKWLASSCAEVIKQILDDCTNSKFTEEKMKHFYKSTTNITISSLTSLFSKRNQDISIELFENEEIQKWIENSLPISLRKKNECLEIFSDLDKDLTKIKSNVWAPLITKIILNLIENKGPKIMGEKLGLQHLQPEDIGGIHEVFSGHKAIWNDDEISLVHDPHRRDAGKIYTPYDVTDYMTKNCISEMINKCENISDVLELDVLDPAVGSGAFLAQFVRNLDNEINKKRKFTKTKDLRKKICEKMIYGIDIDPLALNLTKAVLWLVCDSPKNGLNLNLINADSLAYGNGSNTKRWENKGLEPAKRGFDIVIGNPPYVRVKGDSNFETSTVNNLYSYFVELGINLLSENGIFCMIVPLAVVNSNDGRALREFLLSKEGSLVFQNFDSVPDFLFDQGKIENNTNTNINQRTTIITLNLSKKKEVKTSPLLRWRRTEERSVLFNYVKNCKIDKDLATIFSIPMIENTEDKKLLKRLIKIEKKIGDHVHKKDTNIWIPKAIRYFNTASHYDLERKNTIELSFNEDDFPIAHVILNSNLFYWWWRVFGNGFQIDTKNVLSFPWIPISKSEAEKLSKKLISCADECTVYKRNAGKDIPNINYNKRQDILQEIDQLLLKSIGMVPHSRIFECKTNSLKYDMSALRGYTIEPSLS